MSDSEVKSVHPEPAAKGATVPPQAAPADVSADPPAETVAAAEAADPIAALTAELDKVRAEAAKTRDQLLRTAADFDNFRKRARKDVEDAQRKGLERALSELLPVSDNLERALGASNNTTDLGPVVEGVRMVHKFFDDALSRLGVERVLSVGTPFDPALHEAVQQVETHEAPPGTIVAELVAGYRLSGKLLRAAMVSVARAPSVPSQAPSSQDSGSSEPSVN